MKDQSKRMVETLEEVLRDINESLEEYASEKRELVNRILTIASTFPKLLKRRQFIDKLSLTQKKTEFEDLVMLLLNKKGCGTDSFSEDIEKLLQLLELPEGYINQDSQPFLKLFQGLFSNINKEKQEQIQYQVSESIKLAEKKGLIMDVIFDSSYSHQSLNLVRDESSLGALLSAILETFMITLEALETEVTGLLGEL